jgi:hypothetical protein
VGDFLLFNFTLVGLVSFLLLYFGCLQLWKLYISIDTEAGMLIHIPFSKKILHQLNKNPTTNYSRADEPINLKNKSVKCIIYYYM